MGFYFDLTPTGPGGEYTEQAPPPVFWVLYAVSGFALTCMGVTSFGLLRSLATESGGWDALFLDGFLLMIPIYLVVGLRLAFVRKFVRTSQEALVSGFSVGQFTFFSRCYKKENIQAIVLTHKISSPNLAAHEHQADRQYHFRGHFRVCLILKDGKRVTLDRSTDEAALEPLRSELERWLG